jgi:hypothetical protein
MANPDSVSQYYLDSFGNGRIAVSQTATFNTTGNATVTGIKLPFLGGGLTNANATVGSGGVIVRRVTVNNPIGNISNVIISVTTSSDGNISNAVVANTTLSNLTGPGTYQDLTIASPYNSSSAITGFTTQALYVNVNTGSGNVANTATIAVYGDVVSF